MRKETKKEILKYILIFIAAVSLMILCNTALRLIWLDSLELTKLQYLLYIILPEVALIFVIVINHIIDTKM